MQKSTFRISKMDCPSEEQIIRLKLDEMAGINSLYFDIQNRQLTVFHSGSIDLISEKIDSLKLDSSLIETTEMNETVSTVDTSNEKYPLVGSWN